MSDHERRYKFLRIDADRILDLLNGWRQSGYVALPRLSAFPEDCRVEAVRYTGEFVPESLLLKVYHPSFPILEDNCMPPVELARVEVVKLAIEQPIIETPQQNRKKFEFLGAP